MTRRDALPHHQVAKSTHGEKLDELPDSDDDEEKQRVERFNALPPGQQQAETMEGMQRLGHRVGKLIELIYQVCF